MHLGGTFRVRHHAELRAEVHDVETRRSDLETVSTLGHSCGEPTVVKLDSIWRLDVEARRAFQHNNRTVSEGDLNEAGRKVQMLSGRELRAEAQILTCVGPHAISRRTDPCNFGRILRVSRLSDLRWP